MTLGRQRRALHLHPHRDGLGTNLFPNFSNCMPGDSLTQTIRVQADGQNGVQGAKIYLRAEIDGDASAKEAPPSRTTMCSITSA